MRIVSFLPSATEMVYALGLGDRLVGVTHECDYPPEARGKPVVVTSSLDPSRLSSQEIDRSVRQAVTDGRSLYVVNERLLEQLEPDVILTQDLCQVCAPSGHEMERFLSNLPKPPRLIWLTPSSLSDILDNLMQLGKEMGKSEEAGRIINQLRIRINRVASRTGSLPLRPRVYCMEWLSPPYSSGHWVPELVELAGGVDGLGRKGQHSIRLTWETVLASNPEVLILAPCGFDLDHVVEQAHHLGQYPHWNDLAAVQNRRVYAVDANSYFARPGPRIVDGIELLAAIIHPDQFEWSGRPDAYRHIDLKDLVNRSGGN